MSTPPLAPGHHHIDVAAAAPGADKPIAPIGNACLGAVPLGHLRRVGLGPVTARLAPDHKSDTGRSRIAQCHRRTWRRLLPPLRARRVVSAWLAPAVVHIASAAGVVPFSRVLK
jgi:hypothetical protein